MGLSAMASSDASPIPRTKAKKATLVVCVYIAFLMLGTFLGLAVLAWGVALKLFEDCVLERCFILQQILNPKLADAAFAFLNWNGYTWLFLVVIALLFEAVLIAALFDFKTTTDQRKGESAMSTCFVVTLRIIIALSLTLGTVTFLLENFLKENMASAMISLMNETALNMTATASQNIVDAYQNIFMCCGSLGPDDWETVSTLGTDLDLSPLSCYTASNCHAAFPAYNDSIKSFCDNVSFSPEMEDTMTKNYSITIFKTKRKKTRGCNNSISSSLFICYLALFSNGLLILILHLLWCLWRKEANLSLLCCRVSRQNAVEAISINERSQASSQSLIFVKQRAFIGKSWPGVGPEKARPPFHVQSKTSLANASSRREFTPAAAKSRESATTLHNQERVTKTKFQHSYGPNKIMRSRSDTNLPYSAHILNEETRAVWASNVATRHVSVEVPEGDELSIYSVESIEW